MLLSLLVIPLAGFEDDEVLFLTPFRLGLTREFIIKVFHRDFPLMIMSYLGALKTWLYFPFWKLAGVSSVWGVRAPAVAVGIATLIFFSYLCYVSAGKHAAWIGTLLLACQPVYLLTSVFDWGPVAIEHLLLTTACFCFVRYSQNRQDKFLKWGFFLLGLALWNKAIFLWALAGLTVASVVFWTDIRSRLTLRNVGLAAGFFLLGAFPFVLYNVRHFGATIGENAHFDTFALWPGKLFQLRSASDGFSLFGFLTEEEGEIGRAHV